MKLMRLLHEGVLAAAFPVAVLILCILFPACSSDTRSDADRAFEALAWNFIESYLRMYPEEATILGDHRYDSSMNDYSADGVERAIDLRSLYLDSLKTIKVEELSPANRIDYDIFQQNLEKELFALRDLRGWENNPLTYNVGNAIFNLVAREFAPLQERMKSIEGRLKAIPRILEDAKKNLRNPPSIHTQTAIQQNDGIVTLLTETLAPFIDSLPPNQREELISVRDSAVNALRAYGDWLKKSLLPNSNGSFRLGKDLYERKLRYSLDTDLTREEILTRAERDLESTTMEMHATAVQLWAKYYSGQPIPAEKSAIIRAVLNRLADDRPTDESIVDEAKEALKEADRFVREKNIVSVPDDPIDIIVMPEFQRGVAVAYCESPGPLEKNGKTFYAISPTPQDWPPARKESFYREYNNSMLKNLTVHEAIPGHYLQLVTGNRFKASTILRGVFQSGIFAEGWATYAEQIMVDAGFGGLEVKIQQLKMRLRLIINVLIDQKIHTAGMTEKEAMDLMVRKGFQENGEAAGKWRRACLTSTQLSTYYVGNLLFNDIRKRYEALHGSRFSQKEFHDRAISFGTISPKYLPMLLKIPMDAPPPSLASTKKNSHP